LFTFYHNHQKQGNKDHFYATETNAMNLGNIYAKKGVYIHKRGIRLALFTKNTAIYKEINNHHIGCQEYRQFLFWIQSYDSSHHCST
jgi:hypothetical protein